MGAVNLVNLVRLISTCVLSLSRARVELRAREAPPLILAVDTVGTYAQHLEDEASRRGAELVQVWSAEFADFELARGDELAADERAALEQNRAPEPDTERAWAVARFGADARIAAVCCVSDHGLATSERLAHALGCGANGVLPARRDKFAMSERVRAAGLQTARQALASDWPTAAAFLASLPEPRPCVLKPRRGCASAGVFKASSLAEARAAFTALVGMPISLDCAVDVREGVLVQELICGDEYAVDVVSRGGEHKAIHLWRYDKREVNGAHFVYQATALCEGRSTEEEAVMAYACAVLDALDVVDGPAHVEVRLAPAPRGPVLIEANIGRWHGIPYSPMLGDLAQGYNAFGAVMDACLDPDAWARIPARPTLKAHARMVHLVLTRRGRLADVRLPEPGDARYPTLIEAEAKYRAGDVVERPSTDLKSDGGHLLLLARDAAAVARDYERVVAEQESYFPMEDEGAEAAPAGPYDVPSLVRAVLELGDAAVPAVPVRTSE